MWQATTWTNGNCLLSCTYVSQEMSRVVWGLTHWGRVTHICVVKLTTIGWDNGLSPGRRQAIIWTNAGILLIRTLGTNFSEILGEIHSFSFKKMRLKMSSAKWRLFGLGLNELISPIFDNKVMEIIAAILSYNYWTKYSRILLDSIEFHWVFSRDFTRVMICLVRSVLRVTV